MDDDPDLLNADQMNAMGNNDQEQLTQEEKDEQIIKTLNTNNPQAAHNLTKFSYKERVYRTDELVDQLTFHFSFDGDVILKDSDEAREQEDALENKKRAHKGMLDKINVAIKEEFGKDPCKFHLLYPSLTIFKYI